MDERTLRFVTRANEADFIRSFIADSYIVDMGFVLKVYDNKRVDVKHLTKKTFINTDEELEIVTRDVELLFFSSANLGIEVAVEVGDIVLLLGLRACLMNTNVTKVSKATTKASYRQETMKALPISVAKTSTVKLKATDAGLAIDFNEIVFNEGTDFLAKFNELKSGFDQLKSDFNTHVHSGTGVVPTVLSTASIDDAKIDNMKV